MGRFRDIFRNGPISRATRGNVWPLVASTVGSALGGPLLGQVAGQFVGNRMDRNYRQREVAFSPSPEMANTPGTLQNELGLTNWSGSQSDTSGRFGPLMGGYGGLPDDSPDQGPSYDPDFVSNLVSGYQSQPLMSSGSLGNRPSTGNISQGGTRGFGVQGTTDIGGTLAALSAFGNTDNGGGNIFEWIARHRPPVER